MSDAMQPVPKDSPLMKAWEEYKASADYANSCKWARHASDEFVDGSLWAAFAEGFRISQSQNVGAEKDAARYRARREAAFQSHTTEQIAVRNVPLERAEFNAGYDEDSDAAMLAKDRT